MDQQTLCLQTDFRFILYIEFILDLDLAACSA